MNTIILIYLIISYVSMFLFFKELGELGTIGSLLCMIFAPILALPLLFCKVVFNFYRIFDYRLF